MPPSSPQRMLANASPCSINVLAPCAINVRALAWGKREARQILMAGPHENIRRQRVELTK